MTEDSPISLLFMRHSGSEKPYGLFIKESAVPLSSPFSGTNNKERQRWLFRGSRWIGLAGWLRKRMWFDLCIACVCLSDPHDERRPEDEGPLAE